ncbi:type I-E CRISPR-associated protein Cse2/CasB [Photobacterium galatheae]|nr:type I-E CRISPR-associated protein Cse2/CasB [Photobacterium galatheae]MCM0151589.1 type I-E CRISPR-associated protein Cse2/CasB [Photobacterium galatheae]
MMDDTTKNVVHRWWQSMYLSPAQLQEKGIAPAPSGQKAQLKRCESADAAMMSPGFRALWQRLPEDIQASENAASYECWATIAAALVHVKTDTGINLATAAGLKAEGDKSVVSELRFAQLQSAKTPDEFLRRLRRILQQVGGQVSVIKLAEDIDHWYREHTGFRPRQADKRISVKWAMDYYRAVSAK